MILFKPLKNLEKKYSIVENENLFRGACGKIYSDGGDFIKIPFDFNKGNLLNDSLSQKRIYNEAKIHDLALGLGIKLPLFYGLFAVKDVNTNLYYPGLAMKNLGKLIISKLEGSLREKAEFQRKIEIDKARDLGFVFRDNHDMNAVWVPDEEQTYLLDCGLWDYRVSI